MTMIPILASALLGSWTYAGFLDEPTVAPRPPAVIVVPDNPGSEPSPDDDDVGEKPPLAKPEAPVSPPTPPASTPAGPARYRLTDAWGQVWEHADSSYLRSWVDARNRSVAPSP